MNISNPIHNFFLGDKRIGWLRFFLLVILPIVAFCYLCYQSFMFGASFQMGWLILLYFFCLLSALSAAVHYVQDIFNEDFDKLPARYVMAAFFGLRPPKEQINARKERSIYERMVDVFGGPAYLEVDPGWAVLTESLTTPGKTYGHGKKHFMSRYERIGAIVNLHEQEATLPQISAYTRDGIKVLVDNAKFNYRIFDNREETHKHDQPNLTRKPFPYAKIAILDYAYKRGVGLNADKKPEQTEWEKTISGKVKGIICEFINEHKLDQIIAPRDPENKYVREEIRKKGYSDDFKAALQSNGAMLTWWDPGEFRTEEKDIENQFVTNWSADIQSEIAINNAHGEARRMAYEELGRAEAEAELLMSIIHALEGIKLGRDKMHTLQNLILLRTAQVIKAFGYNPPTGAASQKNNE
jgi:hypothetical protein